MLQQKKQAQSANFTMAANSIGDVLVAKGLSVPEGTTLKQMALLIQNNLIVPANRLSGSYYTGIISEYSELKRNITFSPQFAKTPSVSAILNDTESGGVGIWVTSATAYGCTILVRNNMGRPTNTSKLVSWVATA